MKKILLILMILIACAILWLYFISSQTATIATKPVIEAEPEIQLTTAIKSGLDYSEFTPEDVSNYSLSELFSKAKSNEAFTVLNEDEKLDALDFWIFKKCRTSSNKYIKDKLKKFSLGSIDIKNQTGSLPAWASFTSHSNRLNVLMLLYHVKTLRYCDHKEFCKPYLKRGFKSIDSKETMHPDVRIQFDRCNKLLTVDLTLDTSLNLIKDVLDKFKDGGIDSVSVKSVMNSVLTELEKKAEEQKEKKVEEALDKAEKEKNAEEDETKTEEKKDSTKVIDKDTPKEEKEPVTKTKSS